MFYDPLDGPISAGKIFGIIVYLVLASISVWATSESINSSFNVPIIVSYLLGIAFVLTLAIFLGIIKQALEERRVGVLKIAFVAIVFLVLWGVSLSTNTHKLFTQLKLEDIRKNELDLATIELENIGNNSLSIGNQVIDDYNFFVTSRIQNYKREVRNPENCGHGPVADTLMSKVQRSMPGSIFTLPSGRGRSQESCRVLAKEMADAMTSELNDRVDSMREHLDNLGECSDEEKRQDIVERLREYNDFSTDFVSVAVKDAISNAHNYYNELYKCYNNGLIQSIGSVQEFSKAQEFKHKLELPVPSIDLEKISALLPFIKNHPKDSPGAYFNSFLFSLAIALILDLAAFVVFYFVILKKD